MAALLHGPFGDETPGDVPLPRAPLIRTLAQIRFPTFSAFMADEDGVARRFAAALAKDYPLFQVGNEVAVTITPEGVTQKPGIGRIWKLGSADESWHVTLSQTFLSLDTSAYTRRSDFAAKLAEAWSAFTDIARPPFVERLGVRYVNRLAEPSQLARLSELVRGEVLGVMMAPEAGSELLSAFNEALFKLDDGASVQARWGMLPPGMIHDPTLPPVASQSWLLDLDAFHEWVPAANPGDNIADASAELSLRAYQFFRWAVTDEYLREFGGEVG
jgi:uncharacterized protein (TIGR04255 family)